MFRVKEETKNSLESNQSKHNLSTIKEIDSYDTRKHDDSHSYECQEASNDTKSSRRKSNSKNMIKTVGGYRVK